jgi:hypothetical protein
MVNDEDFVETSALVFVPGAKKQQLLLRQTVEERYHARAILY